MKPCIVIFTYDYDGLWYCGGGDDEVVNDIEDDADDGGWVGGELLQAFWVWI